MDPGHRRISESAGIGRQARLRGVCQPTWEFKSPLSHHKRNLFCPPRQERFFLAFWAKYRGNIEKSGFGAVDRLLILILAQKGSAAVKKLWFVPEVLMFIMQIVYISDTFSLLISNFYYFWAVLCTRGLPYSLICIAGLDLTGTWLRDTTIAE